MTGPIDPAAMAALLQASWRGRADGLERESDRTGLTSLSQASFRWMVAEALAQRAAEGPGQGPPEPADPAGREESVAAAPPAPEAGLPPREATVIAREAQRTGIDPNLLAALRRAENGRAGREFGVLSVPAPGLDQQARVAANTIRNMAVRFERQGGTVLDPATGRYSESFLRFFSARYAPRGAANDPTDLNRFHAANLIALYRRVGGELA